MNFLVRIGNSLYHHPVTYCTVGDEHFIAGDYIVITILDGSRLVTGHIRPGVRLGIGACKYGVSRADRRKVFLFLLFRSIVVNVFTSECRRSDVQAYAHTYPGNLLRYDGVAQEACAAAAVFFRYPAAD